MFLYEYHKLEDTWKAMCKLVELKLVRDIGVSNFNIDQCRRMLECGPIKPSVNQVECHPYLQQDELLAFCKENDIGVTAYCPLGSSDKRPWAQPDDPYLLE